MSETIHLRRVDPQCEQRSIARQMRDLVESGSATHWNAMGSPTVGVVKLSVCGFPVGTGLRRMNVVGCGYTLGRALQTSAHSCLRQCFGCLSNY
jgi:hypothetical protein